MKKRLLYSFAVFLLLTSCMCSVPAFLQGKGAGVAPEYRYIFETPSNPISVTLVLDTAYQAEAVIPPEGGTLSLTGGDGTIFQLIFPSGALVVNTTIRMTWVKSLSGIPFGAESYAVQLEPEGLELYAFAVLTITPAAALPLDQQIPFSYQGSGEDFALALPVVDAREIKVLVDHFSGYGVNKGFLADVEPVRQRIGGSAEARLRSTAAELLGRERQKQLLGAQESEFPVDDMIKLMDQFEEQVVKPRIAAAGESCAAGRLAMSTLLGFERTRALLGFGEDGLAATLKDSGLLDTVATVCMKEEYELCRDDHIIHRIIPAWLGVARQYALLGVPGETALQMTSDYVRKCLKFELVLESQMDFSDSGGGYTSNVESTVKLQFDPASLSMKGEAPLVNTFFEFRVDGCGVTSNRGGGTFTVMGMGIIPDKHSAEDELGYTRDIKLVYFPGNTSESFTVNCPDTPSYTSPPDPLWTAGFLVLHQFEMSQEAGGFIAEEWGILGGELFAKMEWIRSDAGLGITEAGTFKLYHRPE
jgi:hypothetical protein